MTRIILQNPPPSTQHIYRHNGNRVYMTEEGKNCKETYQWEIKSQYKGKPREGDISVIICLYFKDKKKRDVDNFNKLILDACSGILWEDDSQIQELIIKKEVVPHNSGVLIMILDNAKTIAI